MSWQVTQLPSVGLTMMARPSSMDAAATAFKDQAQLANTVNRALHFMRKS
jgi:hypothetical protein